MINAITRKDLSAVLPGDVFHYPGHVSMALGVGDAIVHAVGRGQLVQRHLAVPGQKRGQLGQGGVKLVHICVQLDAVAGGEQQGLVHRLGPYRVEK